MRWSHCLTLFCFTLQWLLVSGSVTHRTIDDTYGDWVTHSQVEYTGYWNAGQGCGGCAVQPNRAQAIEGTWHDTTSNSPNSASTHSATLKFNGPYFRGLSIAPRCRNESLTLGTAIWIYCILANNASTGVTIFTNASFELDGTIVGGYGHNPDPSQGPFLYNVSVFQKTDLSNAEHTLVMIAMQEPEPSLLLFDYAVYT